MAGRAMHSPSPAAQGRRSGTALLKLACGPAPHLVGLLSLAVAALAFAASGIAAFRPGG
jgi:hypothetical protein